MRTYPTDLVPTANGIMSYTTVPEAASAALSAAQLRPSPVDKIVGAFDALQAHVETLDADGLAVLASCAQQIVLNGFHGKGADALPVRDAAKAKLDALPPPAPSAPPAEGE